MGSIVGDGVIKTKTRTKTQHKVWMILGRVRVDYEPNILYEILKAIQVFKETTSTVPWKRLSSLLSGCPDLSAGCLIYQFWLLSSGEACWRAFLRGARFSILVACSCSRSTQIFSTHRSGP